MKICFVLNDVATEKNGTSTALMSMAHQRGHEVYAMGVGDFTFHHDEPISINAVTVPKSFKSKSPQKFLEALHDKKNKPKKINSSKLDVVFIRNNPTEEEGRQWAEQAGIAFGRMVQQEEVLVLNDAYALSHAFIDKLYFEELPQEIKPDSIITRDKDQILDFWENQKNKKMVLKPLEGSGGQDVYLIDEHEKNVNQIITHLSTQGYVIAQEYLPAGKDGDVRVLLVNGKVMEKDGKKAIIRRVSGEGEFRSNFSVGATADSSDLTPAMQRIIDLTAPKLIRDGLFFVGLDIVDDKLIEINVLSPGGMERFKDIGLPSFTDYIIKAIERKVEFKEIYKGQLSNRTLATMD
ncbi:glutathione synthase [Christiangramia forsetii]|uniref:Glutathione synthetase n=2 Tax=Christiangramia forsetii TaxID=411153 RepID=A0M266_CHRFK|nr:glutathione synthase [Christiangramia forsetii]GGG39980.1 glutathione synthetase [Christiangramia forsetii]CAL66711.1 glutathione synthetase [Christiangramia forsetii KT0803]